MAQFTQGQVVRATFPYKEDPEEGKSRPALVIGGSPGTPQDDNVLVVVLITSFGGGSAPLRGDVEITNWSQLGFTSRSWVRARRLWSPHPSVVTPFRTPTPSLDPFTLKKVFDEISAML